MAFCQRELSLKVFDKIEEIQPKFKDRQDFVINTVSEAKLNSSHIIHNLHNEIFLIKKTYVKSTILEESKILYQLNNQDSKVDKTCLEDIRQKILNHVHLAGVAYTHCLGRADGWLREEIKIIASKLQIDEGKYLNVGLMDAFEGENIFVSPENIMGKLDSKLAGLVDPSSLVSELADAIQSFSIQLSNIKPKFNQCMMGGEQRYYKGIELGRDHLDFTCEGKYVIPLETLD